MSEAAGSTARRRRGIATETVPPVVEAGPTSGLDAPPAAAKKAERPPTILDFYPLEEANSTRLSAFYEALARGKFTTTRCRKDSSLLWPPRVVCPTCHTSELEWVDLPETGRLYAFSAILAGAPLGMEADVPFVVGLVDLDGVALRLFGRIVGSTWTECHVGQRVRVEPFALPDGRSFYRFRTLAPAADRR